MPSKHAQGQGDSGYQGVEGHSSSQWTQDCGYMLINLTRYPTVPTPQCCKSRKFYIWRLETTEKLNLLHVTQHSFSSLLHDNGSPAGLLQLPGNQHLPADHLVRVHPDHQPPVWKPLCCKCRSALFQVRRQCLLQVAWHRQEAGSSQMMCCKFIIFWTCTNHDKIFWLL